MRKLLAGLFLALAALLVPASAAASSSNVVVVGDSILGLSADELQPKLDVLGWTPVIEWVNGSGLTVGANASVPHDWTTRLAELEAAYDPAVVVVVLGTNDAIPVAAGEPYPPHVARLLAATDAGRVLQADCSTRTAVPERNVGCAMIKGDLHAVTRDGYEVLPYDDEVTGAADWDTTDTVHPGEVGQEMFASLIAGRVGPK